jgi:hypothetical protein
MPTRRYGAVTACHLLFWSTNPRFSTVDLPSRGTRAICCFGQPTPGFPRWTSRRGERMPSAVLVNEPAVFHGGTSRRGECIGAYSSIYLLSASACPCGDPLRSHRDTFPLRSYRTPGPISRARDATANSRYRIGSCPRADAVISPPNVSGGGRGDSRVYCEIYANLIHGRLRRLRSLCACPLLVPWAAPSYFRPSFLPAASRRIASRRRFSFVSSRLADSIQPMNVRR